MQTTAEKPTDIKITKEVLTNAGEDFSGIDYISKRLSRSKCLNIPNSIEEPNYFCEFTLALYSQEKINFFYPFIIKYNDGINVQTIIINITGDVSAPGVIQYTTKSPLYLSLKSTTKHI